MNSVSVQHNIWVFFVEKLVFIIFILYYRDNIIWFPGTQVQSVRTLHKCTHNSYSCRIIPSNCWQSKQSFSRTLEDWELLLYQAAALSRITSVHCVESTEVVSAGGLRGRDCKGNTMLPLTAVSSRLFAKTIESKNYRRIESTFVAPALIPTTRELLPTKIQCLIKGYFTKTFLFHKFHKISIVFYLYNNTADFFAYLFNTIFGRVSDCVEISWKLMPAWNYNETLYTYIGWTDVKGNPYKHRYNQSRCQSSWSRGPGQGTKCERSPELNTFFTSLGQ